MTLISTRFQEAGHCADKNQCIMSNLKCHGSFQDLGVNVIDERALRTSKKALQFRKLSLHGFNQYQLNVR